MSFLDRFRKKKEDEAGRVARLAKTGRMADGTILDTVCDTAGMITQVCYAYTLAGVQYESSQTLDQLQRQRWHDYMPGTHIIVRYDPKQPANSIVV